jgi:alkylation response protein AidB-like acyl-CoA dehydrogenase
LVAGLGMIKVLLGTLREILVSESCRGRPLFEDPAYRVPLAKMLAEYNALEFLDMRRLHDKSTSSSPPILTPILKLRASELRQRVTEMIIQALGERALEAPPSSAASRSVHTPSSEIAHLTQRFLYERAVTILGGSSEIQRNIIAAIELGL